MEVWLYDCLHCCTSYTGELAYVMRIRSTAVEGINMILSYYWSFYGSLNSLLAGEQVVSVPDTLVKELTDLHFAFANLQRSYEKEVRKSLKAQEQFVQFLPRLLRRKIIHMTQDNSFQSNFDILMEAEVSLFNTYYLKRICSIFPGNIWWAAFKSKIQLFKIYKLQMM